MTPMARRLTTDLDADDSVPYFLWDEQTTIGKLKRILRDGPEDLRVYYMAKVLREARPGDAWRFFHPKDVWARWGQIRPRLGRMRALWEFLFDRWERDGLLA
jgi:hypothetical protein